MNNGSLFKIGMITLLFISCKTSTTIVEAPILEEELLDTMVVTASPINKEEEVFELEPYQASATRKHDLIHTKLELSFDWENQYVNGTAYLDLKPFFYSTNTLELDAKVFDIHNISLNGQDLTYEYDEAKILITLDRTYQRDEQYTIKIDYTAKPNVGPTGGSAAIRSDKGLFFINPLNEEENKPQQIWTQGETENSSRWFPTIDKPNERCSQEIILTVQDRFETLSNGLLTSSVDNGNGTRTDTWVQAKPHAPYLFMLGIGEYAVVKDQWKNIPLYYYVEPEFKDDAKAIFNHTPEMLHFFSDALKYPFPWDKYAQIVCRDYVSGAMENTGAVVFGEFVQRNTRELLDGPNDDIVAHELFHHWFGDLVTCESWSNLTLNEGFATYSEYLWREYKYGHDKAEKKRLQDFNGYLMSAAQAGMHDLIDFEFEDKEQMFDGHSYNKGGLIVHMLRSYIGDEAFFAGLNRYLTTHEYTDVEAHELRLAFEDVVGEDLNWFFNQWFYEQGHPIIEANYTMDEENKQVIIQVEQTQDPEDNPPIFQLYTNSILYYPSGKKDTVLTHINQRSQEIVIDIEGDEMPVVAVFDGTHDQLAIIKEQRSDEEYFNLYMLSDEFEDKLTALKSLKRSTEYSAVFIIALEDKSEDIRALGINAVDLKTYRDKLNEIAKNDPRAFNRTTALKKTKDLKVAKSLVHKDPSFKVVAEALNIIHREEPESAIKIAEELTKSYYKPLLIKIAEIYASTGDVKYLDFFKSNLSDTGMFAFFNFLKQYESLVAKAAAPKKVETAETLKVLATNKNSSYFKKYAVTNMINNILNQLESDYTNNPTEELKSASTQVRAIMENIISTSSDNRLKKSFQKYDMP